MRRTQEVAESGGVDTEHTVIATEVPECCDDVLQILLINYIGESDEGGPVGNLEHSHLLQEMGVAWEIVAELLVGELQPLLQDQHHDLRSVAVHMVALRVPVNRHLQILHDRHEELHVADQPVITFYLFAVVPTPLPSSELSSVDFICCLDTLLLCHPTHFRMASPVSMVTVGGVTFLLASSASVDSDSRVVLCFRRLDLDYNRLIDIYPNPPTHTWQSDI